MLWPLPISLRIVNFLALTKRTAVQERRRRWQTRPGAHNRTDIEPKSGNKGISYYYSFECTLKVHLALQSTLQFLTLRLPPSTMRLCTKNYETMIFLSVTQVHTGKNRDFISSQQSNIKSSGAPISAVAGPGKLSFPDLTFMRSIQTIKYQEMKQNGMLLKLKKSYKMMIFLSVTQVHTGKKRVLFPAGSRT